MELGWLAAYAVLERADGPTVICHEENPHEWAQSAAVDRAAMR